MRHESEVVRVPRLSGWLRTIKAVEAPELRMEKLELDESSHLQPTGRFEAVALDAVIVVLSQERAGVSLTLISSTCSVLNHRGGRRRVMARHHRESSLEAPCLTHRRPKRPTEASGRASGQRPRRYT